MVRLVMSWERERAKSRVPVDDDKGK